MIIIRKPFENSLDPRHRQEQMRWFSDVINRFVNAFRKRVMPLYRELS
jgi:hypothetical protein